MQGQVPYEDRRASDVFGTPQDDCSESNLK